MESNAHNPAIFGHQLMAILIACILGLSVTSVSAETYRWKDKDGKTHYGAMVPAEYADQPYDILNSSGVVIEHVEDTSVPLEVIAEKKVKKGRAPLISIETRRLQSDRLLVMRYGSEEEIRDALEREIAQLGSDAKIINQSYESTTAAIRSEIRLAADMQRFGQQIQPDKQKAIDRLYIRKDKDKKKLAVMVNREARIRARYEAEIVRYRDLTTDSQEIDQANGDQG